MKKILLFILILFIIGCAPVGEPEPVTREIPPEVADEIVPEEIPEPVEVPPLEEQPTQLVEVEISGKSPDVFYNTQAECTAAGGQWLTTVTGKQICNIKMPDAGKPCSDTIQCNGLCVAPNNEATSGRCSNTQILTGCNFYLLNGKVAGVLCVD